MIVSPSTAYQPDQHRNRQTTNPNFWQTQARIRTLVDEYLAPTQLCDRLEDLPRQFEQPQPRPWQPIDWHSIHPSQVVGIDLKVFLAIVVGAMDTEAPIRGYTQTSRQYLAPIHTQMAQFVGGVIAADGSLIDLGLWEKEERQHSPALAKLYYQLTGEKAIAQIRTPKAYRPSGDPQTDLYRHGLHRVATEYSAVCLYLWLMAHTIGTTHLLFEELLKDEINHMTKFWGFGLWAYPEHFLSRMCRTLGQPFSLLQHSNPANSHLQFVSDLQRTLRRMMGTLAWKQWSFTHKAELVLASMCVLSRLWHWSNSLTPEYLNNLFGDTP